MLPVGLHRGAASTVVNQTGAEGRAVGKSMGQSLTWVVGWCWHLLVPGNFIGWLEKARQVEKGEWIAELDFSFFNQGI